MKSVTIATTSFALVLVGILTAAMAQDTKGPQKNEVKFVCAEEAKFKEMAPGASRCPISGDAEKGAYRAFTKFPPAASFALHTHPNDIDIVVVKGAYVYKPEKGEERRVGPGCYLHIPAGDRHVSGGDPKDGALFYEESQSKFGLAYIGETEK